MAPRVRNPQGAAKKPAKSPRGEFFPGEVVRILNLQKLDYRQLRHLFRIVRAQAGEPISRDGKWARFTFRDLVALKAAFHLAGGEEALAPGRKLRLHDVERICKRLQEDLGLSNPLTEVAFRRVGRTVIAQVQGVSFEPTSGQMVLTDVVAAVERYIEEHPGRSKHSIETRASLEREAQELRELSSRSAHTEARLEVSFR
jgi:hypothetical protein